MIKKGFTLIELLAAIVLLAVGLTVMMQLVARMLQLSSKQEYHNNVVFLAEREMEEVEGRLFGNFSTNCNQAVSVFAAPHAAYKYVVTDDLGATVKTIAVTVWHDADNDNTLDSGEESLALTTKIARKQP